MSGLTVPELAPDADVLTAALAYANAGWYVGPERTGTKHPGSVLGDRWQTLTSRDPKVIAGWFAGTDHGVFLHCGRSGALVFDVDTPENLTETIARAVTEQRPPWQSTRPDQPARRHYVFAQPAGRMLGNSLGRLAGGWGEIRGRNGAIIVAPSAHAEGGQYDWGRVGPVPELPPELSGALDDALDAADAATDDQVLAFLAQHQKTSRPDLLDIQVSSWMRKVEAGESRHDSITGHLAGAMKEARIGCYPAQIAADTLQSLFMAAVTTEGHGKQGKARDRWQAKTEWSGLLAWAVAQALTAEPAAIAQRLHEKAPDFPITVVEPPRADPGSQPSEQTDDEAEATRAGVRRLFPRLDIAALLNAERPPRRWVMAGLLPEGASIAVVAPAGSGKSLLLLASMIAVARGDRTFAGLPLRRHRVLLVDMENTEDDLSDRFTDLGVTAADAGGLDDLIPIHLPLLAPLDTAMGAMELSAIMDAYDLQRGDVVVLDSLQRVISGPENDSDTMRSFYRHTAVMLKRRGVTVIRTDNTGKDTEKGARGTSGKRDDVDVELIIIPDAERPGRFRITPGKTRLPGIEPVLMQRTVDDETGLLTFTTAGDPFRHAVIEAIDLLEALEVPLDDGERKVVEAIKKAGRKVPRTVLRVAIKERRDPSTGAPNVIGAPLGANGPEVCATQERRSNGAPPENTRFERGNRAQSEWRTHRAGIPDAPRAGAPPSPFSIERARPSAID